MGNHRGLARASVSGKTPAFGSNLCLDRHEDLVEARNFRVPLFGLVAVPRPKHRQANLFGATGEGQGTNRSGEVRAVGVRPSKRENMPPSIYRKRRKFEGTKIEKTYRAKGTREGLIAEGRLAQAGRDEWKR